MSHFSIVVIGANPEAQLAKYEENSGGDSPRDRSTEKWDFYTVGGRWLGFFKMKSGLNGAIGTPGVFANTAEPGTADRALKRDIDLTATPIPFAVVVDGKWFERGEMGWFASVTNEVEPDEWAASVRKLYDAAADNEIFTMFDCHI